MRAGVEDKTGLMLDGDGRRCPEPVCIEQERTGRRSGGEDKRRIKRAAKDAREPDEERRDAQRVEAGYLTSAILLVGVRGSAFRGCRPAPEPKRITAITTNAVPLSAVQRTA
jgi:hypothetical protein